MSVTLNDYFLLNFHGSCFDQRIMLTHAYRVENPGSGAVTENAAALGLIAAVEAGGTSDMVTQYLGLLPPQYTLTKISAQKVWPTRYRYWYGTYSLPGTHAENTESTNLAGVITITSRLAGRGEVGNKHIGPMPYGMTSIDNGLPTPAYKALLNNFGQLLLNDVGTGALGVNFRPIILHRQLDDKGHVVSMSSTDVYWKSIGDVVGTMRRRTVGRGI